MDRAKELLSQSDQAIEHWRRRLKDGYRELGLGFPDLLKDMTQVQDGGDSSFARRQKKNKQNSKKKNRENERSNPDSRSEEE